MASLITAEQRVTAPAADSTGTASPSPFRQFCLGLIRGYAAIANKPALACAVAAGLPVVLRLALLPWFGVPLPSVHDEFSYLLGADTFASGRLTNPPHPLWQHFESIHIIQQPTYASKYPPMQALMLAVGMIFGHPWIGVLLSVAIMGACLCWALQGWLSPVVGFTGALLGAVRLGTFSYWGNSYWGGTVTVIGGALVIGALARLLRDPRRRTAFLFALGVVILANSRPFEGAVLTMSSIAVVIAAAVRNRSAGALLRACALPLLATLIPAALAMAYYNYRVTGDALLLPYQLHEQQYAVDTAFLWHQPRKPPEYHDAQLKEFWTHLVPELTRNSREHWFRESVAHMQVGLGTLAGTLWIAAFMVLLPLPRSSLTNRLTFPILIAFLAGILLMRSVEPHYFAPIAALVLVRFMDTAQWLWRWRPQGRLLGPVLSLFAFEYVVLQSFLLIFPVVPEMVEYGQNRHRIEQQLAGLGGQHLVVVRYAPTHWLHEEWVYNRADIDSSRIVWARDLGEDRNRDLLRYFSGRSIWLLQPDSSAVLSPFSAAPAPGKK